MYEFECDACTNSFEVLYPKPSDYTEIPLCPLCADDGTHVRRVLSRTRLSFKGDGWYETSKHGKKRDIF